jgi:phosphatidylglycerol:prolipoprotein diacylglycerol transferase
MRRELRRGKPLLTAYTAINWTDLHLSPVAIDFHYFQLRWYSLAYLAGIFLGYWYMLKLIRQPGAPMAKRHADDLVFYAALGVILGGRIGYVLFYNLGEYAAHPIEVFRLWDGGMSFHGGLVGTILGILYLSWRQKLQFLRITDYVSCVAPIGLFFGRCANFVNGELWGAPTNLPWGVRFPEYNKYLNVMQLGPPRHPSELYEALLEGVVIFLVLFWMFWKTEARYRPGLLSGVLLTLYGTFRYLVEFVREPDAQFAGTVFDTPGLHMGQLLSIPLILLGLWLIFTARKRSVKVDSAIGSAQTASAPS